MAHPPRRRWRVAGYILMGGAGLVALLNAHATTVAASTGWLAYVWAAWLLLGGAMAAVGSATDRWLGEYAGLPLLIASLASYASVLLLSGHLGALAGSLLLAGFASKLVARWQDVATVRREAQRAAKDRGSGDR